MTLFFLEAEKSNDFFSSMLFKIITNSYVRCSEMVINVLSVTFYEMYETTKKTILNLFNREINADGSFQTFNFKWFQLIYFT